MQGLVLSAYPLLDQAAYLLFRIESRKLTRRWLAQLYEHVTPAFKYSETRSRLTGRPLNVNIAFTSSGLQQLCGTTEHFGNAFMEGMDGPAHRSRILGDTQESRPENWKWGSRTKQTSVDVLLMVFVHELDSLDDEIRDLRPTDGAMTELQYLRARRLKEADGHEHFGFKDGISQPILEGSTDAERFPESMHIARLGEFVLGYPDAAGNTLGSEDATGHLVRLPAVHGHSGFGRNGTYLVLRQLEQDVPGFWDWMEKHSAIDGRSDPQAARQLAAKFVGRWPDGTPLVPYANVDDNEFGFGDDPYGYGCPIGAHIRRANPRDSLVNNNLPFVPRNDHRLLRRGRSYGAAAGETPTGERGLLFVCLNADIERQFEFIQQNWINNPAFAGLRNERDPLVGDHGVEADRETITIGSLPAPNCVHGLRRFVRVRGGQYFFLPGMNALDWLGQHD